LVTQTVDAWVFEVEGFDLSSHTISVTQTMLGVYYLALRTELKIFDIQTVSLFLLYPFANMPSINDILPKVSLWKSSPSQLAEMPLIANTVSRISLLAEIPLVAVVLSKASMYKSSLPPFLFTEVFLWTALKAAILALILNVSRNTASYISFILIKYP
jgi:hypothetical protein